MHPVAYKFLSRSRFTSLYTFSMVSTYLTVDSIETMHPLQN